MSTPARRLPVILSSTVRMWATITANRGVVAFRIEASPLAMWVWPHTIRENGMTLLSRPMPKKAAQSRTPRGIRCPVARTTTWRIKAARPTRRTTMVNGGSSFTAIPVKKNDPPQSTERASSKAHSRAVMLLLIEAAIGVLQADKRPSTIAR